MPGSVKADTWYDILVQINGTTVTVSLGGATLTYTYTARKDANGDPMPLSKGFVGAGSDNARGSWDDFTVQVLPPAVTLDSGTSFTGDKGVFTGATSGTWAVTGGRYSATTASGVTAASTTSFGVSGFGTSAWIEASSTLRTTATGGIIFDALDSANFKFAAIDVVAQSVLIGHVVNGQWVVDASVARTLTPNADTTLTVTLKGTSASVQVGGTFILSFAFNAPVVDGALGLVSRSGTTSADGFRAQTNDSHFAGVPRVAVNDVSVSEGTGAGSTTATLTLTLSAGGDDRHERGLERGPRNHRRVRLRGAADGDGDLRRRGDHGHGLHPDRREMRWSEPDEVFYVTLSAPSGLTICRRRGPGHDPQRRLGHDPSVTVNATDASGAETAANPIVFTLTRSGSTTSSLAVAVGWSGTASAADYTLERQRRHAVRRRSRRSRRAPRRSPSPSRRSTTRPWRRTETSS